MAKAQLTTKTAIDKIPLAESGQQLIWDTDLKGFGVSVGKHKKTFIVEASINGNSRRVKVGCYGDITLQQARTRAITMLGDMRGRKIDITAERQAATANGMTLQEGWELYESYLLARRRSANTITQYKGALDRWLKDWINRPLVEITREAARKRHAKLTQDNGPVPANFAMRILRAIWQRARRQYAALPESPTINVDHNQEAGRKLIVNGEKVAPIIPFDQMGKWYQAVMLTDNPIRRDLFLFLQFSGCRSEEARSMKWSQVDLANQTIHFPKTKTLPFTMPLSDFVVELLERRRACNITRAYFGDSEFVFPARTKTGHMATVHLNEIEKNRYPLCWSPHILRHTYISIAENRCSIPSAHARALVNHAIVRGGDSHCGYIHSEMADLRKSQQIITDVIKLACSI